MFSSHINKQRRTSLNVNEEKDSKHFAEVFQFKLFRG